MKIKDYVSKLGGGSFLYRVSTWAALAAMMAFFTPVIHSRHLDNELGPGIYTSNSLEWVLNWVPSIVPCWSSKTLVSAIWMSRGPLFPSGSRSS